MEKIVEKIEYVDKEVLIDKIVEVPKTVRLLPKSDCMEKCRSGMSSS